MNTEARSLAQRQFLWGLSNGIIVLGIAGGFWSGLAASTLPDWFTGLVLVLTVAIVWTGIVVRRVARGFRLRELETSPVLRQRARQIQVGFRWTALMQFLLVGTAVGATAALNRHDLMWPAIGLGVSLHFVGVALIVRVRAYFGMAIAGCVVCAVGVLLPASTLSPAARLQFVGFSMAALVWMTAVYVTVRAEALSRVWWDAMSVTTGVVDRRELAYWMIQIAGWGLYSAVGLVAAADRIGLGLQPALIVGYVLYFGYSIALTDALRRTARRRHWLEETTASTWLRMIAGGLVVGLIQTALIVGTNVAFDGNATQFRHADPLLGVTLGTSLASIMWSVYYVLLTMRRRRREKEMRSELSLREAELSALEAQISPHFLFNALNSIRGLVVENPVLAQDMITRLSSLLRHNLRHDLHHTVSLAAELDVVLDYLALETMRFDERLRIDIAVAPRAREVAVPSMVVQTLVENAVKYGIAPLAAGGDLTIRGDIDGDRLVLDVENTGRLADPAPQATQVGLANAKERLRLLYGDRAELDLTERNGRVAATLRIPVAI